MRSRPLKSSPVIRTLKATAPAAVLWLVLTGHVGSPDTWFQGNAGPYPVIVQVIPAGVVPGVATVNVRVGGVGVTAVSLQANKYDATGGAPPPESALRDRADAALFAGRLWIMTAGSNSVIVNVSGSEGTGSVTVPVVIVADRQLEFDGPIEIILIGAGIFLFAGLITIVGAAARESTLDPGVQPSAESRGRARRVMALSVVLISAALFGGWKWWSAEDAAHERTIFRPLSAEASVAAGMLTVRISDSTWLYRNDTVWLDDRSESRWSPLVDDHGKLMHLFAVRDDMSGFAHLHPHTIDSVTFTAAFPQLPSGRYRIFADIVHESGFAQTIVDSVEVAVSQNAVATADPDDSWYAGRVAPGPSRLSLDDGTTIEWRSPGPLRAGAPVLLTFDVRNATGGYLPLEPYMGMAGHAVIQRSDASVFVHLHPMGTVSMASRMAYEMREAGDTIAGTLGKRMAGMNHATPASIGPGPVSFPYAFPKPGTYRVWVQVKSAGKIVTAAFDASVADSVTAT